jgi:hypothetical protein
VPHNPDEYARFRKLFLEPRPSYDPMEAQALVAIAAPWLEEHYGPVLSWEQLVAMVLRRHPVRYIEAALGEDADVLPPLLRTSPVTLHLPQAHALYLTELGKHRGWSLGDFIALLLVDRIGTAEDFPSVEVAHPGFAVALAYTHEPDAGRR